MNGIVLRQATIGGAAVAIGHARGKGAAAVPAPHETQPAPPAPETHDTYETGHAQGLRTGYEEGYARGRAEAERAASDALAAAVAKATAPLHEQQRHLAGVAAALQASAVAWLREAEDELFAACYATVCRVLGPALMTPDGVRAQAQALLVNFRAGDAVAVHLHPADARLIAQDDRPSCAPLAWVADPDIALGGCVVRGSAMALDARLETVLEEVRAGLLAARAQAAGERT